MTKKELTEILEKDDVVDDYILEATKHAHKKLPNIPDNVDAYDDKKFWGRVAAYLVAVARKEKTL